MPVTKKLSFISDKSAVIRTVIKRTVTKRRASELIALIDRSLKKCICRFLLNFYRQNHFIKKKTVTLLKVVCKKKVNINFHIKK